MLNNRLASSILSADLFDTICSLIGPLIDCIETRFEPDEVADVGAVIGVWDVDDDDDDVDTDDDDDDDPDDDFFSLASCWAFFDLFHFILRFWNQILTFNWIKYTIYN